jgi:crossover junction endodeoxyribonuclease RuvC
VRVLGIDPGSWTTGWGVVERSSSEIRYLASGTINTRGCESFTARLKRIHEGIKLVLRQWAPQEVGVEAGFVARNVQAAFRLGEARGAVLVGAAGEGVDVYEYAPAAVKLAVAGSGRADKEQVARGVARLLGIDGSKLGRDATDALAVAVCHLHTAQLSDKLRVAEAAQRVAKKGAGRRRTVLGRRGFRGSATTGGVERPLAAGLGSWPRVVRGKLQ